MPAEERKGSREACAARALRPAHADVAHQIQEAAERGRRVVGPPGDEQLGAWGAGDRPHDDATSPDVTKRARDDRHAEPRRDETHEIELRGLQVLLAGETRRRAALESESQSIASGLDETTRIVKLPNVDVVEGRAVEVATQ